MFDLSDKRSKRRKTIMGYAQMDAQHGVLLAAMDFEWTCRRAILALSKTPTVMIYDKFIKDYVAFNGLLEAWKAEVLPSVDGAVNLPDLLNKKLAWSWVCDAMMCRNVIVHGTESRVSNMECRWAVLVLEKACDVIASYVAECGKDIFVRISRPRSRKKLAEVTDGGKKMIAWRARVGQLIAKFGEGHWIKTGEVL